MSVSHLLLFNRKWGDGKWIWEFPLQFFFAIILSDFWRRWSGRILLWYPDLLSTHQLSPYGAQETTWATKRGDHETNLKKILASTIKKHLGWNWCNVLLTPCLIIFHVMVNQSLWKEIHGKFTIQTGQWNKSMKNNMLPPYQNRKNKKWMKKTKKTKVRREFSEAGNQIEKFRLKFKSNKETMKEKNSFPEEKKLNDWTNTQNS